MQRFGLLCLLLLEVTLARQPGSLEHLRTNALQQLTTTSPIGFLKRTLQDKHHDSSSAYGSTTTPSSPSSAAACCRNPPQSSRLLHQLRAGGGGGGGSSNTASVASPNPLSILFQIIRDSRRDLVAAAVARSTSIFAMYPVDTIKTRLQMEQKNAFRLDNIYKGVSGSLIGQVPYGVLTFGSYELYKRTLLEKFPTVQPIFLYALSAVLGDLTGSGWLCPSEVVKQKTQAGMYNSAGEAMRGIWQKKGLVGFYEGYFGGIARDVPFRVAQLTTYELTKNLYLRLKTKRLDKLGKRQKETIALTPGEAAICGAIAGSFSAAVTAPLDRFKTLLMTDSAAYGGSVASCAAKIWREEGLAGLATGVVPRVVYIAPSVALFFIVYEQVQQRLDHWKPSSTRTNTE